MIALDTNVVVRLIVDDDRRQTQRARRLLEHGPSLFVPTVLLEAEWVLRGAYGISRERIAECFRGLLGLPAISVESSNAVAQALEWFERGFDFADALHLALAHRTDRFATFDARLARRAQRSGFGAVFIP